MGGDVRHRFHFEDVIPGRVQLEGALNYVGRNAIDLTRNGLVARHISLLIYENLNRGLAGPDSADVFIPYADARNAWSSEKVVLSGLLSSGKHLQRSHILSPNEARFAGYVKYRDVILTSHACGGQSFAHPSEQQ
jgi:hypothetical protein